MEGAAESANEIREDRGPGEEAAKKAGLAEEEENRTSTARIFFIAFLIILAILIFAMVVALGIFIYLKVTREKQSELAQE